jgi:hypothetical protein
LGGLALLQEVMPFDLVVSQGSGGKGREVEEVQLGHLVEAVHLSSDRVVEARHASAPEEARPFAGVRPFDSVVDHLSDSSSMADVVELTLVGAWQP